MSCAPHLMQFLTTCRTLVDPGTICGHLTADLKGAIYTKSVYENSDNDAEFVSISDGESSVSGASSVSSKVPHKKQKTSTKRGQSNNVPLSLKELDEASEISETEAQKGFVDEATGDTYYIIDRIIEYHPQKGYLVHWQGYKKKDRTWQKADEMPEGFTREMKDARKRYMKLAEREKRLFSPKQQ